MWQLRIVRQESRKCWLSAFYYPAHCVWAPHYSMRGSNKYPVWGVDRVSIMWLAGGSVCKITRELVILVSNRLQPSHLGFPENLFLLRNRYNIFLIWVVWRLFEDSENTLQTLPTWQPVMVLSTGVQVPMYTLHTEHRVQMKNVHGPVWHTCCS